jgi:hypothetical protein
MGTDHHKQDRCGMMQLATHVIHTCLLLCLVGLMMIGGAGNGEHDIVVLREVCDRPVCVVLADGAWGEDAAVRNGADGGVGVEGAAELILDAVFASLTQGSRSAEAKYECH